MTSAPFDVDRDVVLREWIDDNHRTHAKGVRKVVMPELDPRLGSATDGVVQRRADMCSVEPAAFPSYWASNDVRRRLASRFPIPLSDTKVAKCFRSGLVPPPSQL